MLWDLNYVPYFFGFLCSLYDSISHKISPVILTQGSIFVLEAGIEDTEVSST